MTVAVAITAAAISLRNDTRATVAFYDMASREAVAQESRAEVFQALVRSELNTVDRENLMTLIAELREGTQEGIERVRSPETPPQARVAQEVFLVALSAWYEGLGQFEAALLDAVDQPQSPVAERDLELALTTLRVGDATYQRFLNLTVDLRSTMDVAAPELPPVAYVGGDPPLVASRVVEAARRSPSLALVVDIGISAVRLTPEEISNEGASVGVIPATDQIDVLVVVANHGNRPEHAVRVALTMSTDGGSVTFQDQRVLDELLPGGQQTAMFAALPVNPSEAYDLAVSVTKVADEDSSKLQNNFHRKRFLVNEAVEA